MRLQNLKHAVSAEDLKAHKKDIMRFHTLLYEAYLISGVIEHFGLNLMCGIYGGLTGLTVVVHMVCEEL